MSNSHFIISCIREKSLDSLYSVTNKDEKCQELNKKLTDAVFGGMSTENALATEAIWSEYSARLVELAYLKGMQDMYNFNEDTRSSSLTELYKLIMGES